MFDLENRVGAMFDNVGDGVPMRCAEHESLQYQKVQCALEQIRLQRRCASFSHAARFILP